VDYRGRLFREGKAMISREVAEIFEPIGTTAETWLARLAKLSEGRLLGRFLAASRQRLREVAPRLGLRHAFNLSNCLVTSGWHEAPCVSHFSEHARRYPALCGRTRAPMPRIFLQPPAPCQRFRVGKRLTGTASRVVPTKQRSVASRAAPADTHGCLSFLFSFGKVSSSQPYHK
jgi:hypothetical protein